MGLLKFEGLGFGGGGAAPLAFAAAPQEEPVLFARAIDEEEADKVEVPFSIGEVYGGGGCSRKSWVALREGVDDASADLGACSIARGRSDPVDLRPSMASRDGGPNLCWGLFLGPTVLKRVMARASVCSRMSPRLDSKASSISRVRSK